VQESADKVAPNAWIVESEGYAGVRIWGLSPAERQRRLLERAGCTRIETVSPDADLPQASGDVAIVRADAICDERLIEGIVATPGAVLLANAGAAHPTWGGPVAARVPATAAAETVALLRAAALGESGAVPDGLRSVAPSEIAPSYTVKLRKFDPPFIYPATPETARSVEDRVFASSYKGVTDLITKWLWPRPAAAVVRVLANAGVQPNTVTGLSWLLTIAAGWLFWEGQFGLGLLCGWAMTFLDTVDGKLARCTMTSSRIGHVLDHGLDNVHPPIWYLCWGVGLHASGYGTPDGIYTTTAIVVIGYLIGRALEAVFILTFGIETHCWRPIDSLFRTITARRNPNMILLTVGTLGGRPELGLVMVAIWTVVSIGFHVERVVQGLVEHSSGVKISRWDETPLDDRTLATSAPPETAS
jgi:phosphatidylglycerophosphate synthase